MWLSMNDSSRVQSSRVRSSWAKSMFPPGAAATTLSGMVPPGRSGLPASTAGAAEHVHVVVGEDLPVGGPRVALLDEREHVGRRRPAAVVRVEDDVGRGRVRLDADPIGVVAGAQ